MTATKRHQGGEVKIDFETIIPKFDAILARGLCSGVGKRDGQMCIEAAICAALDLPHGDYPSCVASAVRSYKIALNDKKWSSPEARARGLRDVGIAQIGSKGVVNDIEFLRRLADKTARVLIPTLFREVLAKDARCMAAAGRCEKEGVGALSEARSAAYAAASSSYYAAAFSSYYYAAAAAAANATAAAAAAAAATANAAAAAAATDERTDKYLLLSASLALEVLHELKSPGCEWIRRGK